MPKKKKRSSKKKVRRTTKPKRAAAKKTTKKAKGPKPIGIITHYFNKINVGIIKLKVPFTKGKYITVRGRGHEFTQCVDSMQRNHQDIEKAKKGWEIGVKVKTVVREGDLVYLAKPAARQTVTPRTILPPQKTAQPITEDYRPAFLPPKPQVTRPAAPPPRPQAAPPPPKKKPGGYNDKKFLIF